MAESWSTRKKSSVKSRGAETAAESSTVRKRGREAGGRRSLVVRSKGGSAEPPFKMEKRAFQRAHREETSGQRSGLRTWKQGADKPNASAS